MSNAQLQLTIMFLFIFKFVGYSYLNIYLTDCNEMQNDLRKYDLHRHCNHRLPWDQPHTTTHTMTPRNKETLIYSTRNSGIWIDTTKKKGWWEAGEKASPS